MATMLVSYPVSFFVDRMTKADERSALQKERLTTESGLPLGDGMVWFLDDDFDNRTLSSGCRMVPFWT